MKKTISLILMLVLLTLSVTISLVACNRQAPAGEFDPESAGLPIPPNEFGCEYPTTIAKRSTALDALSKHSVNAKKKKFDKYTNSRYTTFVFRDLTELEQYAQSYAEYRSEQMKDHSTMTDTSYDRYYNSFMNRYGDVDFNKAILILASIPSPSSSLSYSVSHVDISNGKFVIHVAEHCPGPNMAETAMTANMTLEMIVPKKDAENIRSFDTVKSFTTYGLYYHATYSEDFTSLILLDDNKYVLQSPDEIILGDYECTDYNFILHRPNQTKKYVFEFYDYDNDSKTLPGLRLTNPHNTEDDAVPYSFVYYATPCADVTHQPLALVDSPTPSYKYGSPYPTIFSGWLAHFTAPLCGESTVVPEQPDSLTTYVVKDKEQLSRALMEESESLYNAHTSPEVDGDTYIRQKYDTLMESYSKYDLDKYSLVICGGGTSERGYKYSVSHIDTSDGGFTVYITRHDFGAHAMVTASWSMVMAVPSQVLDKATYVNTRLNDYSYVALSEITDSAYPAYILRFKDLTFLMYTGGENGQYITGSYRNSNGPYQFILTDGNTGDVYTFSKDGEQMEFIECSSETALQSGTRFEFSWYPPAPYFEQIPLD